MLIVDDILLSPWTGLLGICRQIAEMAQKEVGDEEYAVGKLMELQLRYELGEISKEEYDREEEALSAKLNALRQADQE